jgi:hypothetical protein
MCNFPVSSSLYQNFFSSIMYSSKLAFLILSFALLTADGALSKPFIMKLSYSFQ